VPSRRPPLRSGSLVLETSSPAAVKPTAMPRSSASLFKLVDHTVTTTGVVIACYQGAGDVMTGDCAMHPPTAAEIARRERMKREG
jgi:hypothetical protein